MKILRDTLYAAALLLCALIMGDLAEAAPTDWTAQDTAVQAALTATIYVDYVQTREIVETPWHYHELNPLLGEHPSMSRVRNICIANALGSAVVSYVLPPKYRHMLQYTDLSLELIAVGHNRSIGLRGNF